MTAEDIENILTEDDHDSSGCIDKTIFSRSMISVEKIKPATGAGMATWRFKFSVLGKVASIEIPLNKMGDFHIFQDLFKSNFGMYLPFELTRKAEKGAPSPWRKFNLYIEEICIEVEPVESQEWLECDLLVDQIAQNCKVTDDADFWADKSRSAKYAIRHEMDGIGYYLVKSKDVSELAKDIKLTVTMEKLGSVMNSRGIKRPKNPAKKIGKTVINPVWWFEENYLIDRGLNIIPVPVRNFKITPVPTEGGF
jgi:hypothetical protein